MDTTSVVETIAERVERELTRVKAARPALSSRISRAENILVTHLSCRRANLATKRATHSGTQPVGRTEGHEAARIPCVDLRTRGGWQSSLQTDP